MIVSNYHWQIQKPSANGFTLIELLVVVVIIGIIASIALPNYIGAQVKSKVAQVKANMHTCQTAAEAYAIDKGGLYSQNFSNISPYYPGGAASPGGSAGSYPVNPFSLSNDTPSTTGLVTNVQIARTSPPSSLTAPNSGNVCYDTGVNTTTSYAVWGGDNTAGSIAGNGGTNLILSNE
jgi:prepilin-type N-terminal cleavage/methylation domain-containing protein